MMTDKSTLTFRKVMQHIKDYNRDSISRLMSPSDLGQIVKPFVFLDIFDLDERFLQAMASGGGMPLHPHSGIATVTVLTEGALNYDDPVNGTGTIAYGGVEWMRAGGGVWHGKEMSPPSHVSRVQGFQLWLALPLYLENGEPESLYIEAQNMQRIGPAHIIIGVYESISSPISAPQGINYLLVTLKASESWTYYPPQGHTVGWLAIAKGGLDAGEVSVTTGEMIVFEKSEAPIALKASASEDAVFVLGSAVPHPHNLYLGNYSVHTTQAALAAGEQRIAELAHLLSQIQNRRTAVGTIPVLR